MRGGKTAMIEPHPRFEGNASINLRMLPAQRPGRCTSDIELGSGC